MPVPEFRHRCDSDFAAKGRNPAACNRRGRVRLHDSGFEPEAGRSALRRIAPNIVRLMDDDHSLKGRMQFASMNDKYLLGLLANAVANFKAKTHCRALFFFTFRNTFCK